MLTGRVEAYINEAQYDEVSGYTNPEESPHDFFNVGHTSTSISLASGLAKARDLAGRSENIIALIGDGSLSGGEALEGLNVVALIREMVTAAVDSGTSVKADIDHALALSLARNAAIPQGQVLGNAEMDNIVNELFACDNVNYTPSGEPVIAIMKQQDIEHLFDR